MDVVRELHDDDVGHRVSVSLGAAFWVALGAAYSKDIHRSTVASEETAIVKSVSVDSSVEAFRGSQGEFHTVFVAHLTNYDTIYTKYILISFIYYQVTQVFGTNVCVNEYYILCVHIYHLSNLRQHSVVQRCARRSRNCQCSRRIADYSFPNLWCLYR